MDGGSVAGEGGRVGGRVGGVPLPEFFSTRNKY